MMNVLAGRSQAGVESLGRKFAFMGSVSQGVHDLPDMTVRGKP
jgi:hypothetical protein